MAGMTTDEQGNRLSILPGSSRPSKMRPASGDKNKAIASFAPSARPSSSSKEETKGPKKSLLETQREENAAIKLKTGDGPSKVRQNFVRLNTKTNYKPRIRGAAFTNKIMAKKTNSLAAKARWAKNKKIEELKNRDQVTMYGGLGKVGLDYVGKKGQENLLDADVEGDNVVDPNSNEYVVPAFSAQAKELIRAKMMAIALGTGGEEGWEDENGEDDDEEMLVDNIEQMHDELKKIDEQVEDIEVDINDLDKASYAVPDTDEGFLKILKERFGHDEFLEGQLEAIKIIV